MQPEVADCNRHNGALVNQLTGDLYRLAGDQEVRVIEALAAAFANRWREGLVGPDGLSEPGLAGRFECQATGDATGRLAICRRVARRALRGTLVDPTQGATAWHRIEVSPVWARDVLPVGMFGPFLFYRMTSWQPASQQGATILETSLG
jgi:N-acetylmuramoyl-L-alanine amidase